MRATSQYFLAGLLLFGFLIENSDAQRPTRDRPQRGRDLRTPDRLKEGDVAPDFALKSMDGKKTVRLADFEDKKPVALVFGSYT